MSNHQIPYPRWRAVIDGVWLFKGWMNKYDKLGRHEKDVLYPVDYRLTERLAAGVEVDD